MKVTNQAELDAALANRRVTLIEIHSDPGLWLTIQGQRDASRVVAWGSSRVEAWGSSRVVARESSRVVARESSRVEAWGSSSVVAWGSSSVEARESSRVVAWGSSRVVARGSSRVEARESSRVEAWGSSRVVAWGSSRVVAWGSSRVVARGSSTTHAYGGTVKAAAKCAVFLHAARAVVEGGVVIDVVEPDKEPADWCDYHGAEIHDGQAYVYKAVDDQWTTDRGFDYAPGNHVTAPDWRDDAECGRGLHFGPTPRHAREYHYEATRFVKVAIPLDTSRPILGGTAKIKAASCLVLGEVDIDGNPVGAEVAR